MQWLLACTTCALLGGAGGVIAVTQVPALAESVRGPQGQMGPPGPAGVQGSPGRAGQDASLPGYCGYPFHFETVVTDVSYNTLLATGPFSPIDVRTTQICVYR